MLTRGIERSYIEMNNKHAIVLGCGYAGMLAAKILSQHFQHVTIIERHEDVFHTPPDQVRLGIPQAVHLHVLLSQGQFLLDQFMPGILEEFKQYSCPHIDWAQDTRWYGPFGVYPQYASKIKTLGFSRACLDYLMVQHIRKISNVNILIGDVAELICSTTPGRIDSVKMHHTRINHHEILQADLIVDARGRRSNVTEILNQFGFHTLPELRVTNQIGYASRTYQFKNHDHKPFKQFYLQVRPGHSTRGVVISPIQEDKASVTLIGLNEHKPPKDLKEFDKYLYELPNQDLQQFLKHLEPISDVTLCRNMHNVHYQLGRMKKWPTGLIVIGDAACVLNPTYGQGMTVAAKEILLLQQTLTQLKNSPPAKQQNWERTFQKNVDQILALPWSMATGEDQRSLTKDNLPFSLRLMHRYYDGVLQLAVKHPYYHTQLTSVLHMMKKPSVFFRPLTMLRVVVNSILRTRRVD